jgi:hypothetical protein
MKRALCVFFILLLTACAAPAAAQPSATPAATAILALPTVTPTITATPTVAPTETPAASATPEVMSQAELEQTLLVMRTDLHLTKLIGEGQITAKLVKGVKTLFINTPQGKIDYPAGIGEFGADGKWKYDGKYAALSLYECHCLMPTKFARVKYGGEYGPPETDAFTKMMADIAKVVNADYKIKNGSDICPVGRGEANTILWTRRINDIQ